MGPTDWPGSFLALKLYMFISLNSPELQKVWLYRMLLCDVLCYANILTVPMVCELLMFIYLNTEDFHGNRMPGHLLDIILNLHKSNPFLSNQEEKYKK